MGLTWEDLGDGYWRVRGGLFTLYVVELNVGSKEAGMSMQDMEGYDELMAKMLERLPAKDVLSHYAPEQRLADLDRDHQALALPIEVLRLLPEQYLGSLSAEVQAEIRRRLQRATKDEPSPH